MISPPSIQSIIDDFEATQSKEAYIQTLNNMDVKSRFQFIVLILENNYKKYSSILIETTVRYLNDKLTSLTPEGIRQFTGIDD
tara:strand:+ start:1389 stop:1637 length:249 start_codon:yes stop_codon:yes gene_type:complete